jgi:hypothetical protein
MPSTGGSKRHAKRREREGIKPDPHRCSARTKVCRQCGYRYFKGDKTLKCPECKFDRRCRNKPIFGFTVCRMHGALGGVATAGAGKFFVASQIAKAYNRVLNHPQLLSLGQEMALLTARTDDLMEMLESHDARAAAAELPTVLALLETVFLDMRREPDVACAMYLKQFRHVLNLLTEVIDPIRIEHSLWHEVRENVEAVRRISDTERRWLQSNDQLIPAGQVVEVILTMQRITLKYIRLPQDRLSFANDMRALIPVERVGEVQNAPATIGA